MALNQYMHPRNKYKYKKPDFKALAIKYPEFRAQATQDLRGNVHLDFKNPDAVRALTCVLLKDDFDLDIELPSDRLVPTVPQRLNYILWMEDIMSAINRQDNICGIDIGAGASCVYPLLGCKKNKWKFLASETDPLNLEFAKKNITKNEMDGQIELVPVKTTQSLLELIKDRETVYDFCMCNPPFFENFLEFQGLTSSRSDERSDPSSVNTASEVEGIVEGGEVQYVKRMIADSLCLRGKIRIYTSMLGKKTSLGALKAELRKHKDIHFTESQFCQGRTMRWAIAWTFDKTVSFPKSLFQEKKKPKEKPPLSQMIPNNGSVVENYCIESVWCKVTSILNDLKCNVTDIQVTPLEASAELTAVENTWSNQRRKRRQEQREQQLKTKRMGHVGVLDIQKSEDDEIQSPHNTVGQCSLTNDPHESLEKQTEQEAINSAGSVNPREMKPDQSGIKSSHNEKQVTNETLENMEGKSKNSTEPLNNTNLCNIVQIINTHNSNMEETCSSKTDREESGAELGTDQRQVPDQSVKLPEQIEKQTSNLPAKIAGPKYLFKCKVFVKMVQENIVMELVYIDGSRELMHQLMQYFKNKFTSPKSP